MRTIRHKKADCIGCGHCAEIAPHYWRMDDAGLAQLIHPARSAPPFEYAPAFEEDADLLAETSRLCPVSIIQFG